MTIQLSTTLRNARLNVMETQFPGTFILYFRTGAPPANCAAADTGTGVFARTIGGADWLAAPSGGSVSYNFAVVGAITGVTTAAGTIGHFRMQYSGSYFMQGSCGTSSADFIFSSVDVVIGQVINVTSMTFTEGGA